MKKRSFLIMIAAVLLVGATVLTSCTDNGESSKKEREILMTLGSFDVSYEIYRYALLNSADSYIAENGELPESGEAREEAEAVIRKNALGALKNMYAVLAACSEYSISIDDQLIKDKVTSKIALDAEEYADEKQFSEAIKKAHMNKSVLKFLYGVQYCQDELYYAMIKAGDISTDKEYIMSLIQSDAFVRIKQVLIKFDIDDDGHDDGNREDKRALAEQVLAMAKGGSDFDMLVSTYGNDIYMVNNPDGYYIIRGVNYVQFEDAAFALEIGGISDIVETPVGFSIIMRLPKGDAYIKDNYDSLASDYAASVFSLKIESMIDTLDVKTTEAFNKYPFSEIK